MDFITWWFEVHYIAATLLTPFATWMYLLYSDGNIWHEIVSAFLSIFSLSMWRSK